MTVLPEQHPQKLPARATMTTFCDHCHTLVLCEQVRTLHGLKWHCAEATSEAKARPVETLSSAQVEQLRAAEDAMVDRQIDAEILAEEERRDEEQPAYDNPDPEIP